MAATSAPSGSAYSSVLGPACTPKKYFLFCSTGFRRNEGHALDAQKLPPFSRHSPLQSQRKLICMSRWLGAHTRPRSIGEGWNVWDIQARWDAPRLNDNRVLPGHVLAVQPVLGLVAKAEDDVARPLPSDQEVHGVGPPSHVGHQQVLARRHLQAIKRERCLRRPPRPAHPGPGAALQPCSSAHPGLGSL